jgi:RNA polymerase sigma factor (sigma-70 family)
MADDSDDHSTDTHNDRGRDRDGRLLAELRRVAVRDDNGLRTDLIVTELLRPYWAYTMRIVRWQLRDLRVAEQDVEDVTLRVLERMARTLGHKLQFSKPFKYVVLDNIDWACGDFRRQHKRRRAETLYASEDLPPASSPHGRKRSSATGRQETVDPVGDEEPDGPGLSAQARAFGRRIEALHGRDRQIISERFFAGTPPTEIAQQLGIKRGAVDTATHRALRKLLDSDGLADVRNARPRSEGEAA